MRKFNFQDILSRICTVCLALLGFGCSDITNGDDIPLMYGTPTGTFEIKGKVTTEDGKSVQGATVRVTKSEYPSGVYSFASTKTKENGEYLTDGEIYNDDVKVVCLPDNPDLEADSVIINLKFKDKTPTKDYWWYIGHADATVDFKLKKKKLD